MSWLDNNPNNDTKSKSSGKVSIVMSWLDNSPKNDTKSKSSGHSIDSYVLAG